MASHIEVVTPCCHRHYKIVSEETVECLKCGLHLSPEDLKQVPGESEGKPVYTPTGKVLGITTTKNPGIFEVGKITDIGKDRFIGQGYKVILEDGYLNLYGLYKVAEGVPYPMKKTFICRTGAYEGRFLYMIQLPEDRKVSYSSVVDYYDLVEVQWKDGEIGHIPAPFFTRTRNGCMFLFQLRRSSTVRDEHTFHCPYCDQPSFYSGLCGADICNEYPEYDTSDYRKKKQRLMRRKDTILDRVEKGKDLPRTVKRIEYVFSKLYSHWRL